MTTAEFYDNARSFGGSIVGNRVAVIHGVRMSIGDTGRIITIYDHGKQHRVEATRSKMEMAINQHKR